MATLPAGFVLDQPSTSLPVGFQLDPPTPLSANVKSFISSARSDVPMEQRESAVRAQLAKGLPEQAALEQALFRADVPQDIQSAGRFAAGIPGAVPTLVSGAIAEPAAGIAGLATSAIPGTAPGSGAAVVEGVREALTIPPVGEAARGTLQSVGEAIQPIAESIPSPGGAVFEATGSPGLATAAQTLAVGGAEVLGGRFGLTKAKGAVEASRQAKRNRRLIDEATDLPTPELQKALDKKGLDFGAVEDDIRTLPAVFGDKSPAKVVDEIIISKLKEGSTADALFNLKIGKGGTAIKDIVGEEALKQGFQKGDITAAKTAGQPTKREMRKMLKMKRQIHADSSKALDFRPTDVVGDNTMQRFKFIRANANRLRLELDDIAKRAPSSDKKLIESDATGGFLRGRAIDPVRVSDSFFGGLDELGVEFDQSTAPPKLNFKNSQISEDKTSQRIIKSVSNILAKGGEVDALKAHQFKRQLDTMLDFNKKSAAGLTDTGKKFAKTIRRALNDSIRDVSPRYAKINDELSASLDAMDSFDKALGGIDAFADNADVAVGQTLRRLLSNAQSRANLDTALTNLDDVAQDMGGSFDTDIRRLILFNNTLDDRFGATAKGSFKGEIESSLRSGPRQAAKDFAFKKAAEKVQKVRGINDSNAFNIMSKIINRGGK
ncbi:MAG: hypothetical protein V3U84_11500 [Thiotrichaceae bacterium]